jgi:hypothetical protein
MASVLRFEWWEMDTSNTPESKFMVAFSDVN